MLIPDVMMRFRTLPKEWRPIIDVISDNTYISLTDGLYDPKTILSTACWIIFGETDA